VKGTCSLVHEHTYKLVHRTWRTYFSSALARVDQHRRCFFISYASNGRDAINTCSSKDIAMNSSIEESPVHELDTSRHISGENTTTSLSLHDLRVLCRSDTVSVDNLRETLSRLEHQVVDMSTYSILLFDICANASGTLDMVQCVIEYIPGAASAISTRGATPLHIVCMNKNATLDIVRFVYEGCQEAILVKDEFGMIPLFYLCINDELDDAISMEILTLLLEKCPESVQCTHEGNL
jgi:hypothetical protein